MKSTFRAAGLVGITLFLILGLNISLRAEKATPEEMELVCLNWLNNIVFQKGQWASSPNPEISFAQDIIVNDTVVGRYFEIEPTGYVIVPILKEMAPVKIYSDENWLDWSEPDGPTAMIKEILMNRVQMFVGVYGSIEVIQPDEEEVLFGPEQKREWNRYAVSEEEFKTSQSLKTDKAPESGPLLSTLWHQNTPYNNDCPWGDGGRTVVGCVATATAQILAYYQWPPEGTGTHTMYWPGDNSCGGNTAGQYLTANYSDPYDWANIPNSCNSGCNTEQQAALAELNYEVGVAFNMDYGRCGSGAYTADAANVFPTYFRYHDWIEIHYRSDHGLLDYSDIIRIEIENSRPCQYRINLHSIVCDGWRLDGAVHQVHMNYGWGGSNNYWYTIDNLYCPWEGCTPSVEYVLTNIVPDNGVMFSADTTWGQYPLEVQFEGSSPLEVDTWTWDFGDGDSAFEQSPNHTYVIPGQYDVKLEVNAGGENRTYLTSNYITILADSISAGNASGEPGDSVEVIIYATNSLPIRQFRIPIQYPGTLNLALSSFTTEGCRTNYFDECKKISSDYLNKRATFSLYNFGGTPDLSPGSGPILRLFFDIPSNATSEQTASLHFEDYSSYILMYYTSVIDFTPIDMSAEISLAFICGDANNDESVNILDVTYLINFLYKYGPPPTPMRSGDVNSSGECNILDVTYLINYLYKNAIDPNCP